MFPAQNSHWMGCEAKHCRIADIEKGNEEADQYVIARFENQFRQAQAEIAEFGAKQEGGWRSSAGRTVARPDSQ
jgi:hypothetical protein